MTPDSTTVGAAFTHHDPGAHCRRLPAEPLRDTTGQPDPSIHRCHQRLWIDQLGLELDDQQAPCRCVPGQDVDDTSFAVYGEADFGSPLPPATTAEQSRQCLMQVGVRGAGDSVDLRALPAESDVHGGTKGIRHRAQRVDPCSAEPAALQAAHRFPPYCRPTGHVRLAQPLAHAQDPQGVADADVVHAGSMYRAACRRLDGDFAIAHREAGSAPAL